MSSSFSSNSLISEGLNMPVSINQSSAYNPYDFILEDEPSAVVIDLDNPHPILAEDALDFNQELVFDKQTPICNEVEELIKSASVGKATEKNRLIQNFCDFVYCMIWESICINETKNRGQVLCQMAANSYDSIIQNYPLKQDAQDNLFQYLPNQTWPADFLLYMNNLKNKEPTAAWKASNKNLTDTTDPARTRINMFGNTIIKASGIARSYINIHLNRHANIIFILNLCIMLYINVNIIDYIREKMNLLVVVL